MEKLGIELQNLVEAFYSDHKETNERLASVKLGEDKWSLKEIMGHLIDSASNNHQRIVRLQREAELHFPSYHYDWIETSRYNTMPFSVILEAWKNFNILLACLIKRIPESTRGNRWITEERAIPLDELAVDYLRHIKEHLAQYKSRMVELKESGL